jgi:hypothetical protein
MAAFSYLVLSMVVTLCTTAVSCPEAEAARLAYEARWAGKWTDPELLGQWMSAYPLEAALHLVPYALAIITFIGFVVLAIWHRRDALRVPLKWPAVLAGWSAWLFVVPILFSTEPYLNSSTVEPSSSLMSFADADPSE